MKTLELNDWEFEIVLDALRSFVDRFDSSMQDLRAVRYPDLHLEQDLTNSRELLKKIEAIK
jgi:hypothetical protein